MLFIVMLPARSWSHTDAKWECICLCFQQLKEYDKNYPTHGLELVVIVFAFKIQRHCLHGENCFIYTDHKSLKYMFTQKKLDIRQWRQLELVKNYKHEILYHPGKANVIADALSRKNISSLLLKPSLKATIKKAQTHDPQLEKIQAKVQATPNPNFSHSEIEYVCQNNWRQRKKSSMKLIGLPIHATLVKPKYIKTSRRNYGGME